MTQRSQRMPSSAIVSVTTRSGYRTRDEVGRGLARAGEASLQLRLARRRIEYGEQLSRPQAVGGRRNQLEQLIPQLSRRGGAVAVRMDQHRLRAEAGGGPAVLD